MIPTAIAGTILAVSVLLVWIAGNMWHRRKGQRHGFVVFLMTLAGVGVGTALAMFVGTHIINIKIPGTVIPLWVAGVAIVGVGYILEVLKWGEHHTRTPVQGFVTALVLFWAIGLPIAANFIPAPAHAHVTDKIHSKSHVHSRGHKG